MTKLVKGNIANVAYKRVFFHTQTIGMHPNSTILNIHTPHPLLLQDTINDVIFIVPKTYRAHILVFTAISSHRTSCLRLHLRPEGSIGLQRNPHILWSFPSSLCFFLLFLFRFSCCLFFL